MTPFETLTGMHDAVEAFRLRVGDRRLKDAETAEAEAMVHAFAQYMETLDVEVLDGTDLEYIDGITDHWSEVAADNMNKGSEYFIEKYFGSEKVRAIFRRIEIMNADEEDLEIIAAEERPEPRT